MRNEACSGDSTPFIPGDSTRGRTSKVYPGQLKSWALITVGSSYFPTHFSDKAARATPGVSVLLLTAGCLIKNFQLSVS